MNTAVIWDHVKSFFLRHHHQRFSGSGQNVTEISACDDHALASLLPLNPEENPSLVARMARVDENATLLQERASDQHAATENAERGTVSSKSCWINGVYLCAKASCFLLLLNLIFIAVNAGLASNYPENGRFSTWAIIYRGSCTLSSRWDTVLHLIINILSSSILAASNYCMQTLVAPSREQIDKYHSRCQWLDIGNASVRNLRAIGRYRLALWAVLMVSATPFHVLYV